MDNKDRNTSLKRIKTIINHISPDCSSFEGHFQAAYTSAINKPSPAWESQPQEFSYEPKVIGTLPEELKGTFLRNGPGLLEVYGTPLVHPIDGDGMICALRFNGEGKVWFQSKYVKTKEYLEEKAKNLCLYRGQMGTMPPESPFKQKKFKNPSNTNCYYWGGKVVSCWEGGLPYLLDPLTLETMKQDDLDGSLSKLRTLGAHFRYDIYTDSLISFSFKPSIGQGTIVIHQWDRKWKLISQQVHTLAEYYYIHDLLITKNYYLLHQTPFVNVSFDLVMKLQSGEQSPGEQMRFYPEVPSQWLLIPRNSKDPIRTFQTSPCHIYHHINAWEDGDQIFFSSACFPPGFTMEFQNGETLTNAFTAPARIREYSINLKTSELTEYQADPSSCEFPTIHPYANGCKTRYAYLMGAEPPHPPAPYCDIIKYDREKKNRQVWSAYEECGIIGEPVYVPRPGAKEEDDGWVITGLYKLKEHRTEFIILDAKDISKGPITRIQLRHHTPLGFHGTFSPEIWNWK